MVTVSEVMLCTLLTCCFGDSNYNSYKVQVHTSKKACVSVYPSTVQNGILWFWANSDPEFKDILQKKKPPFMPALDDPSYSALISSREINYGYKNLFDHTFIGLL